MNVKDIVYKMREIFAFFSRLSVNISAGNTSIKYMVERDKRYLQGSQRNYLI